MPPPSPSLSTAELKAITEEDARKREEFSDMGKASAKLLAMKRELENLDEYIAEAKMRVNKLNASLQMPPRVQVLQTARVVED